MGMSSLFILLFASTKPRDNQATPVRDSLPTSGWSLCSLAAAEQIGGLGPQPFTGTGGPLRSVLQCVPCQAAAWVCLLRTLHPPPSCLSLHRVVGPHPPAAQNPQHMVR